MKAPNNSIKLDICSKYNVDLNAAKLPKHLAIIMDGNGRWAQNRHRPRLFGHRKGSERVKKIVETAGHLGIQNLSLYAFSEENWLRPLDEVRGLFSILHFYLNKELESLKKNNVRLHILGNLAKLPDSTQDLVRRAVDTLKDNSGLNLILALSYSGQNEIVSAFNDWLQQNSQKDSLTVEEFEKCLPSTAFGPIDLLIRTSGECRVSNFMLWSLAYAELYFCDVLWPDFEDEHLLKALSDYENRDRRFGKVNATAGPAEPQPVSLEHGPAKQAKMM